VGPAEGDQWPGLPRIGPSYRDDVINSTVVDSRMVELTDGFAALADPVRLRIVAVLTEGELCVCHLREQVPVAANLLSYHLRVLREAGLVTASRRGRWVDYSLDGGGFAALWAQASATGVPLPGDQVSTEPRGPACEDNRGGGGGD
jgi:ArsR family transcriptional regulator, arsenate/arsenite/antimonite-responsive transcriptional repressor